MKKEINMVKIADVIKYEGDNSTFIWKHPVEDFNTFTQLIVNESQEAIFFMNGQALDLFGPGRYTLDTQNIPLLGNFINKFTGGETMFHCQVYFINKTVHMGVKWGTPSKVRFIEPTLGLPVEIGACGEMNLMVADARKLLVKIVGTMSGIAWNDNSANFAKSLKDSFRPLVFNAVKRHLPTCIKAQSIDILEIDEHLEELSEGLRNNILAGFEEYGLTIPQFYITEILLPEDDPNFRRLREIHTVAVQTKMAEAEATVTAARRQIELERQQTETEIAKREAERKLIEAQAEAQAAKMSGFAEAEIMQAKGYTQKDVFQTEVQKAYAEGIGNMGSNGGGGAGGGIIGDMVGLGVGMAAAGTMSSQMGDMFKGFMNPSLQGASDQTGAGEAKTIQCSNCGNTLPANAKFCLECGTKVEIIAEDEMICPKCGKKTKKGKFCMECGGSLVNKCPKCGAEVPLNGKFCLECGEKINGGETNEE